MLCTEEFRNGIIFITQWGFINDYYKVNAISLCEKIMITDGVWTYRGNNSDPSSSTSEVTLTKACDATLKLLLTKTADTNRWFVLYIQSSLFYNNPKK